MQFDDVLGNYKEFSNYSINHLYSKVLENPQNLPFDKTIMYCFLQWLKLTFTERKNNGATAMED